MKKYVALGLLLGITISALFVYFRRRNLEGTEFQAIFDSSTVADDLFDGLDDLPDRP